MFQGGFLVSLELDLKMKTFLHATRADFYTGTIRNTCPLEVRVHTTVTAWIVLGSTNTVRVFPDDFRPFRAEWTDVCHKIVNSL